MKKMNRDAEALKERFNAVKNREKFAREHGIKGGGAMIYQHINGLKPISLEAARAYAEAFNCSVEEIAPEVGKLFNKIVNMTKFPDIDESKHLISSAEIFDIPVSDAIASMGTGRHMPENESLADFVRVNKNWVRSTLPHISKMENLAVLSAYGDSMCPTFNDGDTLIMDRGVHDIKIDAVYVLNLNEELYIKRLQRRPDGIMMISDNAQYQPYLITNGEREKFSVLGRVVWAWNGKKL